MAEAALAGGAEWLAVATAAEAAELRARRDRRAGARDGRAHARTSCATAVEADADVVAWTEEVADAAPRVHVKLDTGMGRLGTKDRELALRLAARPNAVGLMTHFATADERGDDLFPAQLERSGSSWHEVRARRPSLVHAANSAAALRDPESHFDMVRCGVAIYGLDPFQSDPGEHGLEPAMTLRSWVAALRRLERGRERRLRPALASRSEPTWLATVPIGYGDGWRRALTNNADVLIGGRRHPLVGAVSMDNITVALGAGHRRGGGRRGGADRRAGRGADPRRGGGAAARHDQLRGHDRPAAARGAGARAVTRSWTVGGALRDELLGREVTDIDIAVEGDPEAAARELAREVRGPVFRLSEAFGAWRVVDRRGGRVYDFAPLQGETIEEDLARRDFTINAMARPA